MKWITGVRLPLVFVMFGVVGALSIVGCSEDDSVLLEKIRGDGQVGETGRELAEPIVVRLWDDEGNRIEGKRVEFAVKAGGGTVSPSSVLTDANGEASVRWILGVPPVWNRVRASATGHAVEFTAWANPGERPELHVILEGEGLDFANEDLAFEEGRGMFLGSPGAILNIPAPEASPLELALTGEAIQSPVGIAFGPSGDLYVCENADPEKSVKRIRPSGLSEVISQGFGAEPFALPNYIAVHSSGEIYLSSTCDDMIYRISPTDGETTEFLPIPGPNGVAFDAQETYMYILTENPAVFCLRPPNTWGGLFRVALGPDGEPGPIEPLVEGFALAGDGMAFDEDGNLYVVFSVPLSGGLTSGVFVFTPDGRFHEFFSVNIWQGEIITNIAFGTEPFDPRSLYCYGFTGRLYRVEIGIQGLTLP
jgi:sugar lactone lactonase YvrE